jgi:subtilase family serine protease
MMALRGHLNPNARAADDQGPADPALQIDYATLYLKPAAAQQAALEKLLIDQQDQASADYNRWLSPEQYGERFGLSRGDIAKIIAWLESQGMKVNGVARGRRWITFSGTAANVGRGFRTEFHRYLTDGEMHFANATVPSIPDALADVVADVEGLDDYYPAPASRTHPRYTSGSGTEEQTGYERNTEGPNAQTPPLSSGKVVDPGFKKIGGRYRRGRLQRRLGYPVRCV